MNSSHSRLLRLIAFFRLLKAALLIALGVGVFRLIHVDIASQVEQWVARLGLDPGSRYVFYAIQRVTNVSPHRMRELGVGTFLYAALFLTEGIGLWLLKRWAEWFTVIATGSLIPIEICEIVAHPTAIKVAVLAINIAIVAYLVYRIRTDRRYSKN